MHAADVDGDGRDEVIIGSAVVDDNGNGLWTTEFGHPDFCFVGDIDPQHPGLEIFYGIEPRRKDHALCLVDAKSGKVLWGLEEADQPRRHRRHVCGHRRALSRLGVPRGRHRRRAQVRQVLDVQCPGRADLRLRRPAACPIRSIGTPTLNGN